MFFETKKLKTSRLTTAYAQGGTKGKPRLLLIHGNCSSKVFYYPLMKRLEDSFDMLTLDLRCFGESDALPVDATRGLRDFSDDVFEFTEAMGWDSFIIAGWSLGGGVAMQYAIDHSEKLRGIILQAPLSPYGFSGTKGTDGEVIEPPGIGSGAGTANKQLVKALIDGDRAFASQTIDGTYVKAGFNISPELKELYIDGLLSTKVGEGMYPGSSEMGAVWPFIMPGDRGINNTMSPKYCNLSGLADIPNKPPVLWLRGTADIIVSDMSLCDMPTLGKLGYVPGWPGEEAFPPQPMVSQTRAVLEKYAENGGSYREVVLDSGHGVMLDNEDEFVKAIIEYYS